MEEEAIDISSVRFLVKRDSEPETLAWKSQTVLLNLLNSVSHHRVQELMVCRNQVSLFLR